MARGASAVGISESWCTPCKESGVTVTFRFVHSQNAALEYKVIVSMLVHWLQYMIVVAGCSAGPSLAVKICIYSLVRI